MSQIEYLDLVDENDQVIWVEDRKIIYNQKLNNYRVVNCFVINKFNQILLPKRDMSRKIFPGCYDFSCWEHVISWEAYDDAVLRWLDEELNILWVNPIFLSKLTPKNWVSSFMQIYKLYYDNDVIPNPKEWVESYDYYNIEEINNLLRNNPKSFKDDFSKVLKLVNDILFI